MEEYKFDFCPYDVLGLSPPVFSTESDVMIPTQGPSDKDIRSAYKKLALKYHPDRHHSKSEKEIIVLREKFEKIKLASEILQNSSLRKKYDSVLEAKALSRARMASQDKDRQRFV